MTRPIQMTTVIILCALSLTGGMAQGETTLDAHMRYKACMDKVQTHAEAAFDDATTWEGLGGGYPARHCALAALVKIGHYGEAAQGLEKLADLVHANKAFKAKLLMQSARAWIATDDPQHAAAVLDAALTLSPGEPHILLVRAQAFALQGAYDQAVENLSLIIEGAPGTDKTFVDATLGVDALVLRGAAYRQLDKKDLALADLDQALSLDPNHPEGLLERGIVHRLAGHNEAARADWKQLLDTAPKTDAARAAAANVHMLDSGLEGGE
ncbi:tetratricopeptide repeat protein [Magnetovibrio blakemorei]|uniref:Uncharacterized protein n=1 Tax=Magnetovibrio blakemorei TaxID=28181 RepID=A0A1E5Q8P0_9PROT|nr:tetratricopeptide repeat protein [Magnetovibrio blakemorei]OEJ67756.1 hypothetical protein BEN30_08480 [Magnetovibrio blakemorei]